MIWHVSQSFTQDSIQSNTGGITIHNQAQNKQLKPDVSNKAKNIFLTIYAFYLVLFGFLMDKPSTIVKGLHSIVVSPDILITDYIVVGGMGACFVNAGLLTLASILLLSLLRIDVDGRSIVAIFLMSGFALFGKNIINIWIIIFGVYLYSKLKKERFSDHVITALLGTSMAPAVTELLFHIEKPFYLRLILALLIGSLIGFIMPPISSHVFPFHQGFNLYNVGFAAGIIGTVAVSIFISYGFETRSHLLWSTGNNMVLSCFLSILFLGFILTGYLMNGRSIRGVGTILKRDGCLSSDFVRTEGFGASLINMGLNGFIGMIYVLAVGGALNGPTIGGILTIVGFGAYGKHARNILPVILGVFIGVLTKIWDINDPRLLLAALFGTALAPISGVFGWKLGILAGFINSSVVLSVGVLHGGMNLYNTGFSSGIVAAIMVPVIRSLKKSKE